VHGFRDAEAGGVAGRQDDAMLGVFTQSRNWTTSAGLSTTGKVCGVFGAGITASTAHGFWSVTV
jgi:hypothetical protein